MTVNPPQGAHVFLDYVNAYFGGEDDYQWLFSHDARSGRSKPCHRGPRPPCSV